MFLEFADLMLIFVVTVQSVSLAYVHSARAKSLLYMLPFPFSCALVATGKGVDATHVAGVFAVWLFPWVVYLLHVRCRLPILVADIGALLVHIMISLTLSHLIPATKEMQTFEGAIFENTLFWSLCAALLVSSILMSFFPGRVEPGHKSPLPVWVKTPGVMLVVTTILYFKSELRGFMPAFPMVTLFAVYEARHSLYTLSSRFCIFVGGFVLMLVALRLTVPYLEPTTWDYVCGLGIGWALYVPAFLLAERAYQRRTLRAQISQVDVPAS